MAESVGFQPEIVSIKFPNRLEVHLLLHYGQQEIGALLGDEFDAQMDALTMAGVPDDAIRFVYGGQRAIAS